MPRICVSISDDDLKFAKEHRFSPSEMIRIQISKLRSDIEDGTTKC